MDPYELTPERRKDDGASGSRSDELDTTPSQLGNRPSLEVIRAPSSVTVSEQSQATAGSQEGILRSELPSRARYHGHDYQHVYTSGNARAHFGDQYIEQQNILPRSADETDETRKQKFMADLGFNLMDSRLATIGAAHVDTCDWLFSSEAYLRWQDHRLRSSHHGFLWIKGKPGAGKSTLMKHALQHMQSHNQSHDTTLSYFFNARGHGLEKATEGMYRSLLHQVFAKSPRRLPTPIPGYSAEWRCEGWPILILQDWFRQAVLGFGAGRKFICYIDALDECDEGAIRLAISNFEELGELAHSRGIDLSICFASRHYPRISVRYHETINLDLESEHQDDILTFIRRKLLGERNLKRELEMKISKRCSGVFLWAALVVQIMNKLMDRGETRSQLLSELNQVPDGIEELLRTIIIDGDFALLSTLQWVLFSKRPFDVLELYFAIKTGVGHLSTARDDEAASEEQMLLFILTSSKGLVEFVGNGTRAQFIHETVREYLLNGGLVLLDTGLAGNAKALSHARLGQWCSEYIEAFTPPRPKRPRGGFLMYSRHHMLAHMESAQSGGALDLRSVGKISNKTWVSLTNLLDRTPNKKPKTVTPILILIRSRCMGLAEAILQRQMTHSPLIDEKSHTTTLESLETSLNPAAGFDSLHGTDYYDTALQATIRGGSWTGGEAISEGVISPASRQVIETLLRCGADPLNLWKAAYRVGHGHPDSPEHANHDFIKMALRFGVDPNTPMPGYPRSPQISALANAVLLGDQSLVESLLSHGASVQSLGPDITLSAARRGSLSMVRSLLVAGARFDKSGTNGRTALHEVSDRAEAGDEQLSILRELLDAGIDVNATDDRGHTALTLTIAYRRHRYDLGKLLLDRGANPTLPLCKEMQRRLRTVDEDEARLLFDRDVLSFSIAMEKRARSITARLDDAPACLAET
jgi:hypothetical protein